MFVFGLETYNAKKFAEPHATGLYEVNRFRDKWDIDSTREEIETERRSVLVFDKSVWNAIMSML